MKFLRRTYDWVLHWADTRWGVSALGVLAFLEAFIFPVPPDPLLIALCLGRRTRSFLYAAVSTVGSVCGGALGYFIGWKLMEKVGMPIIHFYHAEATFEKIASQFRTYDFWAVFIAGFTPIPYKVFTISAGACSISFGVFILASVTSRGARFFLVAGLMRLFGEPVKGFIERYFDWLAIGFVVLLIAGFILISGGV